MIEAHDIPGEPNVALWTLPGRRQKGRGKLWAPQAPERDGDPVLVDLSVGSRDLRDVSRPNPRARPVDPECPAGAGDGEWVCLSSQKADRPSETVRTLLNGRSWRSPSLVRNTHLHLAHMFTVIHWR